MRLILRLAGLLLLAGAFAALVIDGTRSIGAGRAAVLPLSDAVTKLTPEGLARLRQAVQGMIPFLWDPVLVTVLLMPTWLVLGVLGLALLVAARRRAAPIGHSRR